MFSFADQTAFRCVINPDWAEEETQKAAGWQVVKLRPGQMIASHLPHSVSGAALWSVAWNTLPLGRLTSCVTTEQHMAAHLRRTPQNRSMWVQGQNRLLTVAQPLLRHYSRIAHLRSHEHRPKMHEAAALIMQGKFIRQHKKYILVG
jgi:hypothetical protein